MSGVLKPFWIIISQTHEPDSTFTVSPVDPGGNQQEQRLDTVPCDISVSLGATLSWLSGGPPWLWNGSR